MSLGDMIVWIVLYEGCPCLKCHYVAYNGILKFDYVNIMRMQDGSRGLCKENSVSCRTMNFYIVSEEQIPLVNAGKANLDINKNSRFPLFYKEKKHI